MNTREYHALNFNENYDIAKHGTQMFRFTIWQMPFISTSSFHLEHLFIFASVLKTFHFKTQTCVSASVKEKKKQQHNELLFPSVHFIF